MQSRVSEAFVTPSCQSDSDLGSLVCTWRWPPGFGHWRPSRPSCSFLLWELGTRKEHFPWLHLGQCVLNQQSRKIAFWCFHTSLQIHFPSLAQAVAKHFPASHTGRGACTTFTLRAELSADITDRVHISSRNEYRTLVFSMLVLPTSGGVVSGCSLTWFYEDVKNFL